MITPVSFGVQNVNTGAISTQIEEQSAKEISQVQFSGRKATGTEKKEIKALMDQHGIRYDHSTEFSVNEDVGNTAKNWLRRAKGFGRGLKLAFKAIANDGEIKAVDYDTYRSPEHLEKDLTVMKSMYDKKGYEVIETEDGFEVDIDKGDTDLFVQHIRTAPDKLLSAIEIDF